MDALSIGEGVHVRVQPRNLGCLYLIPALAHRSQRESKLAEILVLMVTPVASSE
jgi:hypothetical protein